MSEGQIIRKISREQLYNEIWNLSVAGVAKKYDAPYNELLKLCKTANIPIPPSGYWTQLVFGKPVETINLPESTITEVVIPDKLSHKHTRKIFNTTIETEQFDNNKNIVKDKPSNIEVMHGSMKKRMAHRMVTGRCNTYNREKLYNEVWEKPVVEVAAEYGVSDVAIHKICKSLNVPVPPRGYWAKIRAGVKVGKVPLPKSKGRVEITGTRTFESVKDIEALKQPLDFMEENEKNRLFFAAEDIRMLTEKETIHKKILAYKSVVNEWNSKDKKTEGVQKSFNNYYASRPPFLAGVISDKTLPRVYQILGTLFFKIESLGGSINNDLTLQIRNEHVKLEISEDQDKIPHVLTRQEAQALIKYEDEKRRSLYAYEPKIRKYDYLFNGRLKIKIGAGQYFRDSSKSNIESQLGEILISLYEESEVVRLDRLAKEEEERKIEEETRRKEERRKRYNDEVEQTIALENAALDYETACKIRAYAKAVLASFDSNAMDVKTAAWVEWAMKKADWFDPIVARDDDLFGKRKHGESLSEKTLKKYGYYW